MPEELNRVVTDHLSDLLLCPTDAAAHNLAMEGISRGVQVVGDVMYDALLQNTPTVQQCSTIRQKYGVIDKDFLLLTVHRPSNTDDPVSLEGILDTLGECGEDVIFPVHPRTRAVLQHRGTVIAPNIHAIDPVGYLDMLALEKEARVILTDSGGVQKEAYLLGTPCITLREETEWVETVAAGWNRLAGSNPDSIVQALAAAQVRTSRPPIFGDGHASERIAQLLAAGPIASTLRDCRKGS